MLITNYYRGGTDLLTGFTFDTDQKTYKTFTLVPQEWAHAWVDGSHIKSGPLQGFKAPGDLAYYFQTKHEMASKLNQIITLGFKEDLNMSLDFGILRR